MNNAEQITFKLEYAERMKEKSQKVYLTQFDVERKDFWAQKIFGSPEYSFMFRVLIPNDRYAILNGYEIAG